MGGKKKIAMAELRSLLSSLGLEDVVTYIQSGNAVFRSLDGDADEIAATIEREITRAFKMDSTVLLRTPGELEEIIEHNPFSGRTDPSKLHVVFLDRPPAASDAMQLDPGRSPPDEFALRGREIYPAVDVQRRPGEEVCIVGEQEGDEGCNLLAARSRERGDPGLGCRVVSARDAVTRLTGDAREVDDPPFVPIAQVRADDAATKVGALEVRRQPSS